MATPENVPVERKTVKTKVTNMSPGPRVFSDAGKRRVTLMPGESKEVDMPETDVNYFKSFDPKKSSLMFGDFKQAEKPVEQTPEQQAAAEQAHRDKVEREAAQFEEEQRRAKKGK